MLGQRPNIKPFDKQDVLIPDAGRGSLKTIDNRVFDIMSLNGVTLSYCYWLSDPRIAEPLLNKQKTSLWTCLGLYLLHMPRTPYCASEGKTLS